MRGSRHLSMVEWRRKTVQTAIFALSTAHRRTTHPAFRLLDAKVFEALRSANGLWPAVAIDGKTACGSRMGTTRHCKICHGGLCLGGNTPAKPRDPAIKALFDTPSRLHHDRRHRLSGPRRCGRFSK